MSRSRRKTPICGHTTARTEKWWKQMRWGRIRAWVRTQLAHVRRGAEFAPSAAEAHYDDWDAPKDGKQMFDPDEHPELMRK